MRRRRWALGVLVIAVLLAGAGLAGRGAQPRHVAAGPRPVADRRPAAHPRAPVRRRRVAAPRVPSAPPGQAVPILMYHVIHAAPPGTPFPDLWLPPGRFAGQLRFLAERGFHPVTLARVWAYWTRGARLPVHPIVLSFDDGYQSQFAAAAAMHRRGWPGVLNLVVRHVTQGAIDPRSVRQMIRWGWEVDSHSVTHPDLTGLAPGPLRAELRGSRAWLRRRFGVPAAFFCYPLGRYDAAVVRAVRAAGYVAATTENPGLAAPHDGRFTLDRVRIDATDTAARLAAKLAALGVRGG
jgi:peptidoglycan/xylan/chitin deacetylase (PgdA/CDA1 family)